MARLLGLAEANMPETVDDLRSYVQDMAYSDQLAATPQGRHIAQQILFPPVPDVLRPILHLNLQITNALLPEPIRKMYGLDWGPKRQQAFELSFAAVRKIIPHLPTSLRLFPVTHKMMELGEVPLPRHMRNMGLS